MNEAWSLCAYFQSQIGVRPVAVPYKGLGDSTQALLAGQVDYSCNQAPLTVEHVNAKDSVGAGQFATK